MLSGGVRVALIVATPLLGAALAHELHRHRRLALAMAVGAIAATAALAISVAGNLTAGGELDRTFGTAIPGVDLTVRADSASLAAVLIACLAAVSSLAAPASRSGPSRAAQTSLVSGATDPVGLLLLLAGTAAVAVAGTLVQAGAGVLALAAGVLVAGAGTRHAPGGRSTRLLSLVIGAAGVALIGAAAGLVSTAGSSDLGFVPAAAVGPAVAVPWALAGAAILAAPLLRRGGAPLHAAALLAPAGFLILLRLQETASGALPVQAAAVLAVTGAVVATAGGLAGLTTRTIAGAGQAAVAVLTGLLVVVFGGDVDRDGTVLAGLFLGLELGLLAAPAWGGAMTSWSAASAALVALPGGATAAVAFVALGDRAAQGPGGFVELALLTASLAAAAVGVGRCLQAPPRVWRPVPLGAVLAVVAGLAGGLVPGLALRVVAPALAAGAPPLDVDAGALRAAGAGWPGGYLAVALTLVVIAAAAALLVHAGDTTSNPRSATATEPAPARRSADAPERPRLRALLAVRRAARRPWRGALRAVGDLDTWLETQPQVAAVIIGAAAAVLIFR